MANRDVNLNVNVNGQDQVDGINDAIKDTNISTEKLADSSLKLTKGIAGGFELAAQAAGVFGDETGKAFEETIKRATEYVALSNALKDVAEGFSSENIKGLRGIVDGFKSSAVGAKLFGTTTRAAVTASGIGALLLLLPLIIENFDLIKDAVKKALNFTPIGQFINFISDAIDKLGGFSNILNAVGAAFSGFFKAGASASEEFNKSIEKGLKIQQLDKQEESLKKINDERQRTVKLLEAQGKPLQEIIAAQKTILQSELDILQARKKAGQELKPEQEKRLKDLELEIELLEIKGNKAVEAARKEAFFKKGEEIKAAMERNEQLAELEKENQRRRLEEFEKTNQEIVDSWKKTTDQIEQITIESEQEIADQSPTSPERTAAILDISEKIRQKKQEEFNKKKLEEEITFLKEKTDRTKEEDEILNELLSEQLEERLEKILEYTEAVQETFNNVSQIISDNIQRNIDSINLQIDSVDARFQESVSQQQALQAQLADADGARREQILAGIEQERQTQKKLSDERKKLENERIRQQNKQNKVDYANAIVNSIINTATAVIKAIAASPLTGGLPFSAIVGALGAIQTGIIIANPPKDIPLLAEGGMTGKGIAPRDSTGERPIGTAILHENEWIAPRWMVENEKTGGIIQQLESIRKNGGMFAEGGFSSSTPEIVDNASTSSSQALIAALRELNISVAVTEINDIQTRVNVIESRAGI
jgi:hypothetical protein